MNKPDTSLSSKAATAEKRTAIEVVQEKLRERIVAGEAKPGERLHVQNLREEFGVSTSTVREAISRLLIDSLVVSEQQRGFRVAPLSLKDFRDITDTRKIIEAHALRESLKARTEEWEAELVGAYHRLNIVEQKLIGEGQRDLAPDWDLRNEHFHDCLVKNCNNDWLIRFRRTLHQHSYRYHRMIIGDTNFRRDVRVEHKFIFDSALNGEIDACISAIEEHIETSYLAMIAKNVLS
ncbi:MAG: GntR family transcriptional regulator [Mangrovicoccus sp.]